jgi:hypothetical protein
VSWVVLAGCAVLAATEASNAAPSCAGGDCEPGPASNVIFFEALGNGLLYSLNYERLFAGFNVGLRAGASFFTYDVSQAQGSGNLTLLTFPIVASYYLGSLHHKLELGLGATILYFSAASDSTGTQFAGSGTGLGIAATGVIGYRYLPRGTGPTVGVGFTPLARPEKGFLPWGGLNVGLVF